jgi:putative transposase
LSDGNKIVAPPSLKQAKIKISKEQWRNRNKQLGHRRQGIRASNNAKKYYQLLSKRHARIANVRKDFLQKTTTNISRKYYRIRIEDLNVSGMIANHKLAEAVTSLGFYEFRRMLTYKEAFYGTLVELVDRWYPSSKTCMRCAHAAQTCCGSIQPMPLSERVYNCSRCGTTQDRDLNAAINLLNAPLDRVRAASAELTPVDKKEPTPLVEAGSKRQSKRVDQLC